MRRFALHSGFTVLELMVVIGIIGLLASVAAYATLGVREKGELAQAKLEFEQWERAVADYFIENGRYPVDGDGTNDYVPSDLRQFYPGMPQNGRIEGPWPNSWYDFENWGSGNDQIIQMSIRFCEPGGGDCTTPNTDWAQNYDSVSNSLFWCMKGDCVPHSPYSNVEGYGLNTDYYAE